ncbi:hypothetical protein G6698_00995 [Polynucleobacter paneuropaeus]|jgi:hypothetical protein|uniref:hypothetical protein n=1 Tax=Polynucleobacter sp. MWH-P3-07-1 TaxID=1743173 RepID=UPI001BFE5C9C|nr:hypothetical protein [Polynucleobacter sp. MWH-P3-07-1]MBT8566573.1 hypothetical protein [Polynucleobacter paneuropaeus]MBT8575882.1 hypothetical protein [Polynucleobacter paneuropaeus]QWD84049.1 hypothetical protein ICU98_03000 [Polynucleobacter sp. MWH-P3-07-1]
MNKQEFETLKKIFSAGEFDGVKVNVVNTPRFYVKVGANNEMWLDGKHGLANSRDNNRDWVLKKLKAALTTSHHLGESFAWVCADRVTSETENGSLQLVLGHYGVDEYSGTLKTKRLATLVALNEGSIESVEATIGLNQSQNNRLVFNLAGSEACSTKTGYDRVKRGRFAIVYLNSNTGDYWAEKTEACKKEYAPLAHLKASDISDEDLVRAMGFAPSSEIYRV